MGKLVRNKIYKSNLQRLKEDVYKKPKLTKHKTNKKLIENLKQSIVNEQKIEIKEISLHDHLNRIRQTILNENVISGKQTTITEGFIYLIVNPVWNGWIKAGMTVDFEERLTSYNIYDPIGMYSYIDIKWTNDRKQAEKQLLDFLNIHSKKRKGEWFKIEHTKAQILMTLTV